MSTLKITGSAAASLPPDALGGGVLPSTCAQEGSLATHPTPLSQPPLHQHNQSRGDSQANPPFRPSGRCDPSFHSRREIRAAVAGLRRCRLLRPRATQFGCRCVEGGLWFLPTQAPQPIGNRDWRCCERLSKTLAEQSRARGIEMDAVVSI